MISKIVNRSLLKSKAIVIVVFILFVLTQMLLTTIITTYPSIEQAVGDFYTKANIEDFRLYTIPTQGELYDSKWESDLEEKYDILIDKKEYIYVQADESTSYGMLKVDENEEVNKTKITDGRLPKTAGEVFLPIDYATKEGYKAGDTYKIRNKDYKVTGIGYIPEFTYAMNFVSGKTETATSGFVPIIMNQEDYDLIAQENSILYFSGRFKNYVADDEKKEIYKAITNDNKYQVPMLDENGNPQLDENNAIITRSIKMVPIVLDSTNNPGIDFVRQEINGEKSFLKILSVVILIITICIIIMLFNNIFNSQRKEIGILKAEGIDEDKLGRTYSINLLIILFVALILGTILGYFGLKPTFTNFIQTFFSFPYAPKHNDLIVSSLFTSSLLTLGVVLIVYVLSIRPKLNKRTILLLNNIDTDRPPKIKLNFITKRLNFINKYKITILLKNFGLLTLLIFGVFVSSFLLLMGGTIKTSLDQVSSVTEAQQGVAYDYKVVYSKEKLVPKYNGNSMITDTTNVLQVSSNEIITPVKGTIYLNAYNFDENEYYDLRSKGKPLDENLVYISSIASRIYELEENDSIKIKNPYDNTQNINLIIGGVVDGVNTSKIYMDIDMAHSLFDLDDDYANSEVGVGDIREQVYKYDPDATYNYVKETSDDSQSIKALINLIVGIITVVATTISILTLSVITAIIIRRNKKTISVMKVLGYTDKEVNQMIISPYKWVILFVYIGSIPIFEFIIQQIVNSALKDIDGLVIDINIKFSSTIIGLIAVFVIYFVSLTISKRSIKKITLSESLKTE